MLIKVWEAVFKKSILKLEVQQNLMVSYEK